MVSVKICGLNDEASVNAAVKSGADFVGFIHFEKSPRHISLARAAELKTLLPAGVKSVVVLVDPSDELLNDIASIVKPDFFQLHGQESPGRLREIKRTHPTIAIIKALSISQADDIIISHAFYGTADYLMFDAKAPKNSELPGGNGVSFDWSLLANQPIECPWFLSGGLTPQNVHEAITQTGAQLVDVSSGVEKSPGVKDVQKIAAFIKAAKQ